MHCSYYTWKWWKKFWVRHCCCCAVFVYNKRMLLGKAGAAYLLVLLIKASIRNVWSLHTPSRRRKVVVALCFFFNFEEKRRGPSLPQNCRLLCGNHCVTTGKDIQSKMRSLIIHAANYGYILVSQQCCRKFFESYFNEYQITFKFQKSILLYMFFSCLCYNHQRLCKYIGCVYTLLH